MNLLEKLFNLKESELIHKNFEINHEDEWFWNREHDFFQDREIVMKARFNFGDAHLLDDVPFLTKIGENKDSALPEKYIGFSYVSVENREELIRWLQKFPYSEIITNLDRDGVSTPDSQTIPVKKV